MTKNSRMGLGIKYKKWKAAEKGLSSVVIFILGMPMILMAFGFGIDILRVGYAKSVAQSRLDVAVQAGAALSYTTDRGAVRLGVPVDGHMASASIQRAQQIYTQNTRDFRGARGGTLGCNQAGIASGIGRSPIRNNNTVLYTAACTGGAYPIYIGPNDASAPAGQRIGPPPDFNFCQRPAEGKYGIRYDVVEQVPTIFMRMVGGPQFFNIQVTSEALLRQQYC